MWTKFIIQVICYFIMFLLGSYQGWKMGRKYRPSSSDMEKLSAEELSLLDDALLNEIERRTKEAMKQRRKKGSSVDFSRNGEIESQDATERCPFEEFEGDKSCKH